jgi:uncharacterized protein (TIGR00251 family)
LQLAVSPNAKRTAADGLHDGCLRVRLNAPPVDGKANDALRAWLARELGLPQRGVTLLRGETGRRKTVQVDAPLVTVAHWLAQVLQPAGPKLRDCTPDKKST